MHESVGKALELAVRTALIVRALLKSGFKVLVCWWVLPKLILLDAIMAAKRIIDLVYL